MQAQSPYLAAFSERVYLQLIIELMKDPVFAPNDADLRARDQARELIDRAYEYKVCHLASVGVFDNEIYIPGVHLYARRQANFSLCSESPIISHKQLLMRTGHGNSLLTIVTFHGNHDKQGQRSGDPYLIPPCEACLRRLEQVAPHCLILLNLDGVLTKVPLSACRILHHPRRHNGE